MGEDAQATEVVFPSPSPRLGIARNRHHYRNERRQRKRQCPKSSPSGPTGLHTPSPGLTRPAPGACAACQREGLAWVSGFPFLVTLKALHNDWRTVYPFQGIDQGGQPKPRIAPLRTAIRGYEYVGPLGHCGGSAPPVIENVRGRGEVKVSMAPTSGGAESGANQNILRERAARERRAIIFANAGTARDVSEERMRYIQRVRCSKSFAHSETTRWCVALPG